MWIQPRPQGLCSAVRGYWWKEPFSRVSGRFYLLSLRSGEKMSFPGWSTDLHISPNINISSQQHSNRCTWSDKVSSTKPARGVTNKQMSSGTQLLAFQMPEMCAQTLTQNYFYLFLMLFVISGVWQALRLPFTFTEWISNILQNNDFLFHRRLKIIPVWNNMRVIDSH